MPFVLPSVKHHARRIVDRIFRAKGIAPEIISEIDSHSQIVEMLVRASAYTLLPRAAVLPQLTAGTLVAIPVTGSVFVRTCYRVRPRRRPASAASIEVDKAIGGIVREMSARHDLRLEFLVASE